MSPESREPDEIHEWISFEHADETWLFDVTFLTSAWACIWDQGCLGVREHPTPADEQGCCSFGAHFADDADIDTVITAAARLSPAQWQHHRPVDTTLVADGADTTTVLVDDACVFLNRPDHPGGAGCALHRGALEAGESPLAWKPEVCWQLPLRLEHHEDENGRSVSTLRQWRRHDWGDGGEAFHWWCTEDTRAFVADTPVYERLGEEIASLIGAERHARLVAHLRGREVAEVAVAHPVVRRPSS